MVHSATLEPPREDARPSDVRDLLVLWQHPITRSILPIGRLTHSDDGSYAFAYTRRAAYVEGLRPLPGLPDLRRRYETDHLPAVFRQRVMERSRADFGDYVRSLGLNPERATPWEQIVTSGGRRAGDTLQFMEVPSVEGGRAHARFLASGVRHVPGHQCVFVDRELSITAAQHEAALASLSPGSMVHVEAEIANEHDQDASLVTTDGIPVGWVPACLSRSFRELLALGPVTPTVTSVRGREVQAHLRLVLDLDMNVPDGFTFDRDGLWEPLA